MMMYERLPKKVDTPTQLDNVMQGLMGDYRYFLDEEKIRSYVDLLEATKKIEKKWVLGAASDPTHRFEPFQSRSAVTPKSKTEKVNTLEEVATKDSGEKKKRKSLTKDKVKANSSGDKITPTPVSEVKIVTSDKPNSAAGQQTPNVVTRVIECYHCGCAGHMMRNCPLIGQIICYLCREPGHIKSQCPKQQGKDQEGH
uniref:CCHC-type domain-containing protein n=1 Tax=Bracon brevicornis TaxID=1563983 RepID=A0A6V7KTV8_9HYME